MAESTALLTSADVAERLNLSPEGVRRLVLRGELPAYRVGSKLRFDPQALERYLEAAAVR